MTTRWCGPRRARRAARAASWNTGHRRRNHRLRQGIDAKRYVRRNTSCQCRYQATLADPLHRSSARRTPKTGTSEHPTPRERRDEPRTGIPPGTGATGGRASERRCCLPLWRMVAIISGGGAGSSGSPASARRTIRHFLSLMDTRKHSSCPPDTPPIGIGLRSWRGISVIVLTELLRSLGG